MKQKILIAAILSSTLVISLGIIFSDNIFAQNPFEEKIQYPVEELGNCKNREACKKYCDNPQNFDACIVFAEENNIMPREEIEMAKKFMAGGGKGPGGCRGKEECEAYCDNIDNINECVAFAEENDILPPKELEEAKKVREAIKKGIKPPACGSKKKCDVYCSQSEHMEECISFAEAAGFIPPEELDDIKKILEAIKKGVKPPACRGKEECDVYCSDESHFEECISFAEAAGFIPPEEIEMIRKTGGKGPGGCRGKEECETFCQNEENMETCADFALEHGLMKPEEFEIFKKTGGKGPGGCRGKEECEDFCDNPDNQEICFSFAKERGLISEKELRNIEEGKQKFMEGLNQAPSEVMNCLNSTMGSEMMEKFKSGAAMPPREIGEKMRECFEKFMLDSPERMRPSGDMMSPGEFKEGRPPITPDGSMMNFNKISPEIAQCLKSELGENIIEEMKSGQLQPGPEIGKKVKECMEQFRSGSSQRFDQKEEEIKERRHDEVLERAGENVIENLSRLTPEIKECVVSRLGQSAYDKLQSGDFSDFTPQDGDNIQRVVMECAQQFKPKMPPEGMMPPPSSFISPNLLLGLIFGFIGR